MEKQSLSQHWDAVYNHKAADQVSWYQRQPQPSLQWIERLAPQRSLRILDVGGGASLLVDALVVAGYRDLTVLDLSAAALNTARQRLGKCSEGVRWIAADILDVSLHPSGFDLWHDRAVFHFLMEPCDRRRYVELVQRSLRPEGHLVLATFAEVGPERCSGLPVQRHGVDSLRQALGDTLELLEHQRVIHYTPSGAEQRFLYTAWRAKPQRHCSG